MRYHSIYQSTHSFPRSMRLLRGYPLLLRSLVILASARDGVSLDDLARIFKEPAASLGMLLVFLVDAGMLKRTLVAEAPGWYAPRAIASRADQHYGSKLAGRQTRKLQPEVSFYGRYPDTAAAWSR